MIVAVTLQVCVTGELTLRGALNQVGDIPIKMSGKGRSWAETVIIPSDNADEANEVSKFIDGAGQRLHSVVADDMQGVLRRMLEPSAGERGDCMQRQGPV